MVARPGPREPLARRAAAGDRRRRAACSAIERAAMGCWPDHRPMVWSAAIPAAASGCSSAHDKATDPGMWDRAGRRPDGGRRDGAVTTANGRPGRSRACGSPTSTYAAAARPPADPPPPGEGPGSSATLFQVVDAAPPHAGEPRRRGGGVCPPMRNADLFRPSPPDATLEPRSSRARAMAQTRRAERRERQTQSSPNGAGPTDAREAAAPPLGGVEDHRPVLRACAPPGSARSARSGQRGSTVW